ncbi:hypothetical protein SLNWT_5429 [Streptomyces albus]|uniref:Uncharacterized protein n=1 Tax=Streptomyces albus (strain ATCC 21838 / DSM 41398 / FERM P-419 / JCM 4703 / NBRC 107858) TaxID=1081613 RepID=A0A0B5F2K8_STRA4|nr:hypothetical protein SLNWT_5429 [Streptomyces albus]AOU80109.1 hypothetical protein SLNHY_5418 [Streptomyces albus]AYN35825.1 hypothetical protein DUI70_5330 [Streptomyces albus]
MRLPGSCPKRSTGVGPTQHDHQGEPRTMNFLTDVLAGLIHLVGWLV